MNLKIIVRLIFKIFWKVFFFVFFFFNFKKPINSVVTMKEKFLNFFVNYTTRLLPSFVLLNYNICFNFIYNLWYCSGKPKRVRWYTHSLVFSNDCKYFLSLNRFKVLGRMIFFFWVQIHSTNLIWISHYTWTRTKEFHNVIILFSWGSYKLIPKFQLEVL